MTAPHPGPAPAITDYNDAAYRHALATGQHLLEVLDNAQTGREQARTAVEHFPLAGHTATSLRTDDLNTEEELRSLTNRIQDHLDDITQARSHSQNRHQARLTATNNGNAATNSGAAPKQRGDPTLLR